MKDTLVVDIDGTLSNPKHRLHYLRIRPGAIMHPHGDRKTKFEVLQGTEKDEYLTARLLGTTKTVYIVRGDNLIENDPMLYEDRYPPIEEGTFYYIDGMKPIPVKVLKDWKKFNDAMGDDTPHWDIIGIVSAISKSYKVILCSGRPDSHKECTEYWLNKHGVFYKDILMRRAGDHRDDAVVKQEMLDKLREQGHNVVLSIDDRDRVVNMWRKNGIRCLQVAPGDF